MAGQPWVSGTKGKLRSSNVADGADIPRGLPVRRSRAGGRVGVVGRGQQAAGVVGVHAAYPDPLRAARCTTGEFDGIAADAQSRGHQGQTGIVGPTLGGRRGDPDLEGVAMATDDGGSTGAGLDVETQDQTPVGRLLEQVVSTVISTGGFGHGS